MTQDIAYLLRVPAPTQDEVTSDIRNLDFIDNGPHVARLP